MMLCFVEYGKGYHIAQLEPMGTIFAHAVACAQSLKFGGNLQDVLQKSKPQLLIIIDGRIRHQPTRPLRTLAMHRRRCEGGTSVNARMKRECLGAFFGGEICLARGKI
jgi:hypothetical protein